MKTSVTNILLSAIILSILTATAAWAETRDVKFHWSPSPVMSDGGIVRPEAVWYEVWLRQGDEPERLVATVPDTTYILSANSGVSQRIRVCGIDGTGLRSIMSEWSAPVYFEVGGDIITLPLGAQLRANYPNPFNPETRVVYGIPDDVKSTDVVRLEIFTVQGYRVRTLQIDRSPGWHEVVWNGRDDQGMVVSTGMYVTRFVVGSSVETGKMTMVK